MKVKLPECINKNYELILHSEQAILEFKVYVQLKFREEPEKQILAMPGVCKHESQNHGPSEGNIRYFYVEVNNCCLNRIFYRL